jgi:hypothetical protein
VTTVPPRTTRSNIAHAAFRRILSKGRIRDRLTAVLERIITADKTCL